MTFPADYSLYGEVTIDHTLVGTGGVTGQAVWLPLSSVPAAVVSGMRSDGGDVRFTGNYAKNSSTQITGVSADLGNDAGYLETNSVALTAKGITLATWIYITDTSSNHGIYQLRNTASPSDGQIKFTTLNGLLSFRVYSEGTSPIIAQTTSAHGTNTWLHICATWAVDGTVNLYIDGSLVKTGSIANAFPSGCDVTQIGRASTVTAARGSQSTLAEYASVLTTDEITDLANGAPPDAIATTPARYWDDLSGPGPHAPKIGTGDLTEVGTVGDAASDPPVYEQTTQIPAYPVLNSAGNCIGFWFKEDLVDDSNTDIRLWYNGTDTALAVDDPYGQHAVFSGDSLQLLLNSDPTGSAPQFLDRTANGNDASTDGTFVVGDSQDGLLGKCINLNGSNQRLIAVDDASIDFTSAFTISIVVNINSLPTSGNFMSLISKYDAGGNTGGYDLRLNNDGGTQKVELVIAHPTTPTTLSVTQTLPTGEWLILTATCDGSDAFLYLNGTQIGTSSSVTPRANTKNLFIGAFGTFTPTSSDLGRYFDGKINVVSLFPVAKSAAWIETRDNNFIDPAAFIASTVVFNPLNYSSANMFIHHRHRYK